MLGVRRNVQDESRKSTNVSKVIGQSKGWAVNVTINNK